MELRIHNWYGTDEAIEAFNTPEPPDFHCDCRFAVLPQAILCFAEIGETSSQSHLSSPSHFTWRPLRPDYEPSDSIPWLPSVVREAWDRTRKPVRRIREHHVFLRKEKGEARFQCACGIDLEVPAQQTLPRERAMAAVVEFFSTRRLPRCVDWGDYA